jgi:FKBP-type peptidyl-prolyl cis-trans isomerase
MSTITTPSGLQYQEVRVGSGVTARAGQDVAVHYTGWLLDGSKFDSSHDRGQPFTFGLGRGQVIAGWDEGVEGMQIGGLRKLTIPPQLGYGEFGAGGVIPPNATLVFEVELIDVG